MKDGSIPITLALVLLFCLDGEIYAGITQRDGISQLSHILGGICGAVIGYGLERMRTGKREWPDEETALYSQRLPEKVLL